MKFKSFLSRYAAYFGLIPLSLLFIVSFWYVGRQQSPSKIQMPYQELKVTYPSLESHSDIVPIEDSVIQPILYREAVSLEGLPVKEKKKRFIDLMLPAILVARFRIKQQRLKVEHLLAKDSLTRADSIYLAKQKQTYQCDDPQVLKQKLHTHPSSIVLAQAALESGWGTSRFFVQGNNVFGIWSYDPDEPRLKATFSRGDKSIYVRKYDNLALSIQHYFRTIARVPAYKSFVEKRTKTSDPFQLIPHLKNYSELRELYVKKLSNMIRLNNFTQYDDYRLDKNCIEPVFKKAS